MNTFEFDEKKSASNLSKHGIDFVSSQVLWNDPDLVEIGYTLKTGQLPCKTSRVGSCFLPTIKVESWWA
ncbi:MAG: hypothetical protein GQ529_06025 [Methyloprofundus sp.]|nr:hypothetical protein [Methyloprofundus sp.]